MPLAWLKWRAGSPLFDFVLFFREGDSQLEGMHRPWRTDPALCLQNGETYINGRYEEVIYIDMCSKQLSFLVFVGWDFE